MKKTAIVLSLVLMGSLSHAAPGRCNQQLINDATQAYLNSLSGPEDICGSAQYTIKILNHSISLVEQNCGRNSEYAPMVNAWKQALAEAQQTAADTCVN